jgi:hypothetical protein
LISVRKHRAFSYLSKQNFTFLTKTQVFKTKLILFKRFITLVTFLSYFLIQWLQATIQLAFQLLVSFHAVIVDSFGKFKCRNWRIWLFDYVCNLLTNTFFLFIKSFKLESHLFHFFRTVRVFLPILFTIILWVALIYDCLASKILFFCLCHLSIDLRIF